MSHFTVLVIGNDVDYYNAIDRIKNSDILVTIVDCHI